MKLIRRWQQEQRYCSSAFCSIHSPWQMVHRQSNTTGITKYPIINPCFTSPKSILDGKVLVALLGQHMSSISTVLRGTNIRLKQTEWAKESLSSQQHANMSCVNPKILFLLDLRGLKANMCYINRAIRSQCGTYKCHIMVRRCFSFHIAYSHVLVMYFGPSDMAILEIPCKQHGN